MNLKVRAITKVQSDTSYESTLAPLTCRGTIYFGQQLFVHLHVLWLQLHLLQSVHCKHMQFPVSARNSMIYFSLTPSFMKHWVMSSLRNITQTHMHSQNETFTVTLLPLNDNYSFQLVSRILIRNAQLRSQAKTRNIFHSS